MTLDWIAAPEYLRQITGLRKTVKVGAVEYGVFRERHGPETWTLRRRPLDAHGEPSDSWGLPIMGNRTLRGLETYYSRCIL